MIAVDTNVLIHAHRKESPKHRAALERLEALAGSGEAWGIPVFCLGEFLRLVTHRRLFDPPHSAAEACEALARLLSADNV
ncbi:MAG: type II toxin-antitoxin system VapC family toxin [Rhodospirillaceae bacterium]|nr:type II toxin-antitoxin system VapC family toxin [Rhodospirillaceae bacterium]